MTTASSKPASQATFAVLDFETTGEVPGHPNLPWQIGLVGFAGGQPCPANQFASLLQVGDRPFNPYAPGRHAQLRDDICRAPTLPDLWPQLANRLLGRPLVAHNVATEKKCLAEAFPLHVFGPWIDTLKLVRVAYPQAPSHQLPDLLDLLGLRQAVAALCPGLESHDALYDAVGCALLFAHLLALPGWQTLTVPDLARARPAGYHRARRQAGRPSRRGHSL